MYLRRRFSITQNIHYPTIRILILYSRVHSVLCTKLWCAWEWVSGQVGGWRENLKGEEHCDLQLSIPMEQRPKRNPPAQP